MPNQNYIECPPDAKGTFESMRAYGYHFSEAIADIIDNSITAESKNIWITTKYNGDDSWVRISDDGIGMDRETLKHAMTIGKKPSNNRANNDHGRFGFGLKTASISQVRRLSVMSRCEGSDSCVAVWDLDEVAEHGWKLHLNPLSEQSEIRLGKIDNKTGTIVLWENPDRLIQQASDSSKANFEKLGKDLNHLLGCRYHRFIESGDLKIHFNGEEIDFFNPFVLPTTNLKSLGGGSSFGNVKVNVYLLPHESKFKNKPKDLEYAEGFKGMFDHQGIYLYRNDRLMIMGDWLNCSIRKSEACKLLRVKIDINNTNDEEWRIDVRKCNAIIPNNILPDINRLIEKSREEAKKRYTFRKAKVITQSSKKTEDDFVEIWQKFETRGGVSYKINKQHPIVRSLSDSVISISKNNKHGIATKKLLYSLIAHIENMIPIPNAIAEYSESTFIPTEPYEAQEIRKKQIKEFVDAWEKLGYNDEEIKLFIKSLNIT